MNRAPTPTARRSASEPRPRAVRAPLLRGSLCALLGVIAALLVACGGSSKGLIPTGDAGPLQGDFEAVAHAAETGDCGSTNAALLRTERDFGKLPASVDAGLRSRLREGITSLRPHALELCEQPLPQATATTSTPKTTTSTATATTPTETQTTTTQTTPTTSTPASPSGPGGGTPAPGEGTPGGGSEEVPGAEGGTGGVGGAKVQGPQEGTK